MGKRKLTPQAQAAIAARAQGADARTQAAIAKEDAALKAFVARANRTLQYLGVRAVIEWTEGPQHAESRWTREPPKPTDQATAEIDKLGAASDKVIAAVIAARECGLTLANVRDIAAFPFSVQWPGHEPTPLAKRIAKAWVKEIHRERFYDDPGEHANAIIAAVTDAARVRP